MGKRTKTTWTAETKPRGGRKPGSKDIVPRSVKASVVDIIKRLVSDEPALIEKALREGMAARPPSSLPYVKLAAEYIDGKAVDRVEVSGPGGTAIPFTWLPPNPQS